MTKGEDTRRSVLQAGLRMASQVGLDAVSIGDLAGEVGMSKSGLFAHFASKENLQIAILEEAQRRFIELVIAPALKEPRGEPRVRAMWEHWLEWPQHNFQPGGCIFVQASVELDDKPGIVRDALVASQKDWLETIAQAARIAISEGHFRKNLDVYQFAQEVFSLALGTFFFSRLMRDKKSVARGRLGFERLVQDARQPYSN